MSAPVLLIGLSIVAAFWRSHAARLNFLLVGTLSLSINYLTGTGSLGFRDFTPICTLFDEYVVLGPDGVEQARFDPAAGFSLS